jgi:hypothetical protein
MIDLIEAEVQGQWMRAGPGKVEMLVRGLAVAELKKFFEVEAFRVGLCVKIGRLKWEGC